MSLHKNGSCCKLPEKFRKLLNFFLALLLLLVITNSAVANNFDDIFAVVFIDTQTEDKYGSIPLPRKLIAKAIHQLAKAGANGVVLKFFVDRSKDAEGDQLLANAISELPVVLQARLDNNEMEPNELPSRFLFSDEINTQLSGQSGWIPLPLFSNFASDIGFADFNGFPVSLFVNYQGSAVKSLLLSSIELAFDQKLRLQPDNTLILGDWVFPVDKFKRVNVNLKSGMDETYIPFHEVLDNKNLGRVKGKTVILGYHGHKIQTIKTAIGTIPAHLLFIKILQALLDGDNGVK